MQRILARPALRTALAVPTTRSKLQVRAMAAQEVHTMPPQEKVHGSESGPASGHIKVGANLPSDAKFQIFEEGADAPTDVALPKLFAGKKAVIFGLPGAYTSVCSSKHVPEYNKKAQELFSKGVDVLACISVNDAYVMREWAKSLGVDPKTVMMLADGDASFTKAIGLSQNMPGMGDRSLRYSAFVEDLQVKHLNIEEPGGKSYKVSGPDHMLADLEKLGF